MTTGQTLQTALIAIGVASLIHGLAPPKRKRSPFDRFEIVRGDSGYYLAPIVYCDRTIRDLPGTIHLGRGR